MSIHVRTSILFPNISAYHDLLVPSPQDFLGELAVGLEKMHQNQKELHIMSLFREVQISTTCHPWNMSLMILFLSQCRLSLNSIQALTCLIGGRLETASLSPYILPHYSVKDGPSGSFYRHGFSLTPNFTRSNYELHHLLNRLITHPSVDTCLFQRLLDTPRKPFSYLNFFQQVVNHDPGKHIQGGEKNLEEEKKMNTLWGGKKSSYTKTN